MSTETAVKSRPIIFSAAMVQAILAGRKSQTRRVVKPQPPEELPHVWQADEKGDGWWQWYDSDKAGVSDAGDAIRCPYGIPGDTLWCKEKWQYTGRWQPYEDGIYAEVEYSNGDKGMIDYLPWADYPIKSEIGPTFHHKGMQTPSFPHRWASRITLRIESVRVERVQDISEDDSWAEGCKPPEEIRRPRSIKEFTAKSTFAERWEEIHGTGAWQSNPWVWVIQFTSLTPARREQEKKQ